MKILIVSEKKTKKKTISQLLTNNIKNNQNLSTAFSVIVHWVH